MNSLDSLTGKNIPASSNGSLRDVRAHLDTTTIAEAPCSLSLRGTSGERAGERGTFHRIGAANWNPLSLTLSPLLRRGERESINGAEQNHFSESNRGWLWLLNVRACPP